VGLGVRGVRRVESDIVGELREIESGSEDFRGCSNFFTFLLLPPPLCRPPFILEASPDM